MVNQQQGAAGAERREELSKRPRQGSGTSEIDTNPMQSCHELSEERPILLKLPKRNSSCHSSSGLLPSTNFDNPLFTKRSTSSSAAAEQATRDLFQTCRKQVNNSCGREEWSHMYYPFMNERRDPFTPAQLLELEHQVLVYKFITYGHCVPEGLLLPIRKAVTAIRGLPIGASAGGRGSFIPGGNANLNLDAELGRCRRTDGKKWRCSRPVVPEKRYCERHMHRGRHKSAKKAAEAQAHPLPAPSPSSTSTSKNRSTSTSLVTCTALIPSHLHAVNVDSATNPSLMVNLCRQQQQQNEEPAAMPARRTETLDMIAPTFATIMGVNQMCISTGQADTYHFQLRPETPVTSSISASKQYLRKHHDQSPGFQLQYEQCSTHWPARLSEIPQAFNQPNVCNNSFYLCNSLEIPPLQALEGQASTLVEASLFNAVEQTDQSEQQKFSYFPSRKSCSLDHEPIRGAKSENEVHARLHFLREDWPPRSRVNPAMSIPEMEDEDQKATCNTVPPTQLSISIFPTSIVHAGVMASENANPVQTKSALSALSLSMYTSEYDKDKTLDRASVSLGMVVGSNASDFTHQNNHNTWFPAMGGPLAEALQSSLRLGYDTKTGLEAGVGAGLSFLMPSAGANYNSVSQENPIRLQYQYRSSSCLPSPTGVLQRTAFGSCFSDSSSRASSPAPPSAAKPEGITVNQNNLKAPLASSCGSSDIST